MSNDSWYRDIFNKISGGDSAKLVDHNYSTKVNRLDSKNLFYVNDLNDDEKASLVISHKNRLNDSVFKLMTPNFKSNLQDMFYKAYTSSRNDNLNRAGKILANTADAYRRQAINSVNIDSVDFEYNKKLLCFYGSLNHFIKSKELLDANDRVEYMLNNSGIEVEESEAKDDSLFLVENLTLDGDMREALLQFIKKGNIVHVLKEAEDVYADVAKIEDKYTIRIADDKYYVASDEIKVQLRDPGEQPGWACWFLGAVPMTGIVDRASLLLLPEEEREKHMPKEISDMPIVCHASLWDLGGKSGVILHTSWNHIAVCHRWKIDKPIEIASMLFKTVRHPAHIARNFGYATQMNVPGDDWF